MIVTPGLCRAQTIVAPGPPRPVSIDDSSSGFYAHVSAGALLFSEGAVFRTGGAVIPAGTISIDANETLIVEAGYRRGHWGVSLTGGFPPVAKVGGAGSLADLGQLGRIRYGPVVLAGQYFLPRIGKLQPYVGGGPVFLLIFENEDDAVRQLRVRESVGAAVQGGLELPVSSLRGVFVDVKKALLRTHATAVLGAAPISGRIRLDPLVVSGGLSIRF